ETTGEEEIFERLCKILVEEIGFLFVWVGVPDYNERVVKPIFWYGFEDGYLSKIKMVLDPNIEEAKGPTAASLREGYIVINPDSRTNPHFKPFREEALKRGYLSSVAIPIFVKGNLKYVINIYSSQPQFFREEIYYFLAFLKENIEYALERVEKDFFYHFMTLAFNESDEFIFVTDINGDIKYVNPYPLISLGYEESEIFNKNILTLFEPVDRDAPLSFYDFLFAKVCYIRKKNGELLTLLLKSIPFDVHENRHFYLFIGRDITMDSELMNSLEKIKITDFTTDAYTLYGISKKFEEIFPQEYLMRSFQLILFVNLDLYNFSAINELYGFEWGDTILKALVERLKEKFGETLLVARVASDEFLLIFTNLHIYADIVDILERLDNLFREPFIVKNETINLKYHLGVSIFPRDGSSFEELYRKANLALNVAKKEAPNTCEFYESSFEGIVRKNLEVEKLVEAAFENKWFKFYLQPYFNTEYLSLAGAEALIRIVKPGGEVVSPYVFIEALERSPLRRDFEIWAMKYIIELINQWKLPLGINIYPDSFFDELLWLEVQDSLKTLQAPLIIEITERAIIKDPAKLLKIVEELKKINPLIHIALDDFGTGYSNFEYLLNAVFDEIKIDLSFVKVMDSDERRRVIVKCIIDVARILGMKSLAEGVENEEILKMLDIMGCDYVQGYYFDKPLPLEEFQKKY
ncbi:MAG: EAL domain-containing protein, partial [Caldimicrobium sp.]